MDEVEISKHNNLFYIIYTFTEKFISDAFNKSIQWLFHVLSKAGFQRVCRNVLNTPVASGFLLEFV
jgi:hypothetical protein